MYRPALPCLLQGPDPRSIPGTGKIFPGDRLGCHSPCLTNQIEWWNSGTPTHGAVHCREEQSATRPAIGVLSTHAHAHHVPIPAGPRSGNAPMSLIGQKAPDVALRDPQGRPWSLAQAWAAGPALLVF